MFGPLCVSVAESDPIRASKRMQGLSSVELRLDAFDLMPQDLSKLVRIPGQCLLTCRPGGLSAEEQQRRLLLGVAAGPALLDVDMDAPEKVRLTVLDRISESGSGLLLSRHWYHETPKQEILEETVGAMLQTDADFVKIASFCHTSEELASLMGLYSLFPSQQPRLVVLGMGPLAVLSRLAILQLGAPFTFVAPAKGVLTAPGQLRLFQARQILEQAGLM